MKFLSSFRRKITTRFKFQKSRLQFTTWSSSQPRNPEFNSIQSISQNPFFFLLNLCRTISSVQKIQALLIVNGEATDPLLRNKLIGLYGLFGRSKDARLLFDEMPDPDYGSCKVMIRWYFMNDLYSDVIEFHKFMRRRFLVLDNVVFSIVLKACTVLRDFNEGRMLHGYIVHVGSPDSFVLTGLVDMYAKCEEINNARKVFEMIRERNVVCWTSMIVGYVQNNCAKEGLLLFNRMRDCLVEGNSFTLGSVVTACAKLGALQQGKWVHGNVIKNGIEVTPCLYTSLVDMYVKCGAIHDAHLVFHEFHIIDLVSWTAMITGYAQNGFPEEALSLFSDKKWVDVYPNSVTLASVLSSCAQLGNLNVGSSVHSLAIKLGQDDTFVMNALVDMYGKCCKIGDAVCLFHLLEDKDVISWNSMIGGYSQNGYACEALILFKSMIVNGFRPDPVTIVTLLSSCASLGDIWLGSSLHALSIRKGFLAAKSVYIGTALLSLYAKCGNVKSARNVFNEMAEKNAVTWSAMIGGYGKQGDSNECLALLNDMKEANMEPTDIVFTTILSACSHTGRIQEGWRYFETMCRVYKFVPSMRHYACMVDLLARSGSLEEALEFIEKMPVKPDCDILGAFLNGCNIHARFDLGDFAVRKLLELHPDTAGQYMLMSKFYASGGRWNHASQLRNFLKERGLRKQQGLSRVDVCIDNYPQRVVLFG